MIKKPALAAAIIALGFGASGAAHASAFGTSILQMDNFLIKDFATGNTLLFTDFSSLVGNNSGSVSAAINGPGLSNNDNDILQNPIDLPRLCVGDCAAAPGENDFTTTITPPPTATFASADNQLIGTAIDFGGGTTGADAKTRADASIASSPDFGNSGSFLGLTSTFDFLTGTTGLSGFLFSVNYDAYLDAYTSPDEVVPANAFASMAWNLTLRQCNNANCTGSTTEILSWSPEEVNLSISVDAPLNSLANYSESGSLSNSTGPLAANTFYRLTVSQDSNATARAAAAVPEPGSLALLGLGLFGIAGFGKRVGAKRS